MKNPPIYILVSILTLRVDHPGFTMAVATLPICAPSLKVDNHPIFMGPNRL